MQILVYVVDMRTGHVYVPVFLVAHEGKLGEVWQEVVGSGG
jgi:hypothetical protein